MSREDLIKANGTVTAVHGLMFKIKLDGNGLETLGRASGKFSKFLRGITKTQRRSFLLVGDTVAVELSPYDLTKCFIVYRTTAR
jgi:translation initiation factor IF-1